MARQVARFTSPVTGSSRGSASMSAHREPERRGQVRLVEAAEQLRPAVRVAERHHVARAVRRIGEPAQPQPLLRVPGVGLHHQDRLITPAGPAQPQPAVLGWRQLRPIERHAAHALGPQLSERAHARPQPAEPDLGPGKHRIGRQVEKHVIRIDFDGPRPLNRLILGQIRHPASLTRSLARTAKTMTAASRQQRSAPSPRRVAPVATVDDYFNSLDASTRAAFEHIRDLVMEIAPEAGQGTSYGMATLTYHQKPLLAFLAAKHHLSIFPFSSQVVDAVRDRLAAFELSRGTIRFTAATPLPDEVVRDIVRHRIQQITGPAR
jgi:uncharacterized protein YdhG (YjbR/CyaY superfamily)